jgi:predicted phosphodiesterase
MAQPSLPAATKRRAEELGRQHKTLSDIAKRCKISTGSASNILREAGIPVARTVKKGQAKAKVHAAVKEGGSFAEIERRTGVPASTARVLAKEKETATAVIIPAELPPAYQSQYLPYTLNRPGMWGIISDIHIPYHDITTVTLFVDECIRRKVAGVVLNGDILDCHEISRHDKDPSAPRYVQEIEAGRSFMAWLRKKLGNNVDIVFKTGNHEARLDTYILGRAPALFGLENVNTRGLLHLTDLGIEYVTDKRVIRLGKLHIVHGHEYQGGGGVNPARWLFLRAGNVALCGHFHRVSEHHERDISGASKASWSTGCACFISPQYAPLNNWGHGFAFVDVDELGGFAVENKRVFNGKIV